MSRIPVITATIDRLIAERTGPLGQSARVSDDVATVFIRATARRIPLIGKRVDTLELGSIDVPIEHQRTGVLREVLAYMEEAALKTPNIRGVFLEIVHATELTDFYRQSGYVNYDPNNRMGDVSEIFSYFKDLRPELAVDLQQHDR